MRIFCKMAQLYARPLTPALSPVYEGEGEMLAHGADKWMRLNTQPSRHSNRLEHA
ncbi:MAG: hypothetical protein JWP34_4978 [Massilia sp.]|nr:hypothetical protein [Massilia sp.]